MKGVQCYELFGGIDHINHVFIFIYLLVYAFGWTTIDYCNSLLFGSTHDVTFHL